MAAFFAMPILDAGMQPCPVHGIPPRGKPAQPLRALTIARLDHHEIPAATDQLSNRSRLI